jgi:hypothetical protein
MRKTIIAIMLMNSINGFGQTFSDLFTDNEQVICEAYINGKLTRYDLDKGDSIKKKGFVYLGHSNVTYYNGVKNEWGYEHYLFTKDVYLGNNKWLSESQSKTDSVKGWIIYYHADTAIHYKWGYDTVGKYAIAKQIPVTIIELHQPKERAIAIYDGHTDYTKITVGNVNSISRFEPGYGFLIKILVAGKEFDLSKKYEFIKDEELLK